MKRAISGELLIWRNAQRLVKLRYLEHRGVKEWLTETPRSWAHHPAGLCVSPTYIHHSVWA